jgi:hypothetical protein
MGVQVLSSWRPGARRAQRPRARLLELAALLLIAVGISATQGCSSEEFCSPGSYECSGGATAAGSAGSAGNAGAAAAGSGGTAAGSAGSAGTSAGGTGGAGATAGDGGNSASGGSGGNAGSAGSAGNNSGGEGGAGNTGGEAGVGGEAGAGGNGPVDCVLGALEAGCVLPVGAGIFVSAESAAEDPDGSQAAPFPTITEAIDRAGTMQDAQPIFVCTGTYGEHLTVTDDGLQIQGGFVCAADGGAWTYDPEQKARIAPTTRGAVLTLTGVSPFAISDVEMVARDAVGNGESSIAVIVSDSAQVTFARTRIIAGDGRTGLSGVVESFTYPGASVLAGNNATSDLGAAAKACSCPGAQVQTVGGAGGRGGLVTQDGTPGEPASLSGGAGGSNLQACDAGGSGGPGGDGAPVNYGPGALQPGTVNATGWTPADGLVGENGGPGKGGGGGKGNLGTNVGGGGGGACGGCGGRGGNPGKGGGASIGILAYESEITVADSTIVTGDAGDGGDGVAGQQGQNGGAYGLKSGNGCNGGNGGKGANGGAGGGGAGGVSVAVVWSGETLPVLGDTMFELGTAGDPGLGGTPGTNDGVAGVSVPLFPEA